MLIFLNLQQNFRESSPSSENCKRKAENHTRKLERLNPFWNGCKTELPHLRLWTQSSHDVSLCTFPTSTCSSCPGQGCCPPPSLGAHPKTRWDGPWSLKQENPSSAELHRGATNLCKYRLELQGTFFRHGPDSPASPPQTAAPNPTLCTPDVKVLMDQAMRTTQPCPRCEMLPGLQSTGTTASAQPMFEVCPLYRAALVCGWWKALLWQRTRTPTPAQPYKIHSQEMYESIKCCEKFH